MNQFKKRALTIAVSSALAVGASSAKAVTVGESGGALLVPYVIYDDTQDTFVGITVARARLPDGTAADNLPQNWAELHWYFFNRQSAHVLDNTMPVSENDFAAISWRTAAESGGANLNGVEGYLVIGDNLARDGTASRMELFGDAAIIRGAFESAAFIPVLGMRDINDVARYDEVRYSGGLPFDANPVMHGMPIQDGDPLFEDVIFDMRYALDPNFAGGTELVLWYPRNYGTVDPITGAGLPTQVVCQPLGGGQFAETNALWNGLPVEVFDNEQDPGSAAIPAPFEVNVIDVADVWGTGTLPWTIHDVVEKGSGVLLHNEGFILFDHPEVWRVVNTPAGPICDAAGELAGAVAFSLLSFGTLSNANQVQTTIAHERSTNSLAHPYGWDTGAQITTGISKAVNATPLEYSTSTISPNQGVGLYVLPAPPNGEGHPNDEGAENPFGLTTIDQVLREFQIPPAS